MDLSEYYRECRQCPRSCGVDRTAGAKGFCGEDDRLRAAVACLHFGEEPCITVCGGSGTVFFSGCTLRCAFCQNYQISQQGYGAPLDEELFVRLCLDLQNAGAENINLVTPSHHIPLLAKYIGAAKKAGAAIPFCWNSSAYESTESLELLRGLVDIWLPDLKTLNHGLSEKLFAAKDYPDVAKKAVRWMMDASPLKFVSKECRPKDGVAGACGSGKVRLEKMLSGVIVRHLFLPGRFEETADTLEWLKRHADGRAVISLMSQYTPVPFKGSSAELEMRTSALSSIENRLVSKQEDSDIRDLIDAYDFDRLFYQELSTDTDWLPDFTKPQPFGNKLARVIWHCAAKD